MITAFALVALIGHGEHEHIHHTEWDVVGVITVCNPVCVYVLGSFSSTQSFSLIQNRS